MIHVVNRIVVATLLVVAASEAAAAGARTLLTIDPTKTGETELRDEKTDRSDVSGQPLIHRTKAVSRRTFLLSFP